MHRIMDWFMLLLVVAILFLAFRPGSLSVKLADTVGRTTVNLLNAATGGGGWSGTK